MESKKSPDGRTYYVVSETGGVNSITNHEDDQRTGHTTIEKHFKDIKIMRYYYNRVLNDGHSLLNAGLTALTFGLVYELSRLENLIQKYLTRKNQ